ncbi:MAG: zinc ribbon domain-containing protein [archaeon]
MADVENTQSSSVILDRDEWLAFTAEVRKLVQAYEALVTRSRVQMVPMVAEVRKRSLGSRILRFLRLKKETTLTSYDSYYGLTCPYCGADHEAGEVFCRICGRRMQPQR